MYKRKKFGVVISIAIILLIITILDTFMVFRMTSNQTKESGSNQVEKMSGKLENTISDAKNVTMNLALQAQALVSDKKALEEYVEKNKEILSNKTKGSCYNLYIAGTGWDIIPDLIKPEGFVATERDWYIGAKNNEGNAYVTAPYIDAWTGDICYSVSVLLDDGDTVLGIDYTMANIEEYIGEMQDNGASDTVIVTDEGIIAAYSDESLVTKQISAELPKYAGIFSMAKANDGVVSMRVKSNKLTYDNLFAMKCTSGWYIIVSENDWDMYKDSYLQLIVTIVLNICLVVVILLLYLNTRRNQEKAENALAAKDQFVSNISEELREPLRKIMSVTEGSSEEVIDNFNSEMNKIKNAGNQLSGMIEQLISYSNIVKAENNNQTNRDIKEKTKGLNRRFRAGIITLLVIVMCVSLYTNVNATYKWGQLKMQHEASDYEDKLSEWIGTQKSILDMFCSIISNNPEMLDDYESTIKYLNDITVQYPEISVSYMTNPELEHTVYMNNGWEPDADWHVEERQWYIDTLNSEEGWSISAPYYDEQTGIYCVTISESVYDAKTGEFLGNFGIDFYMDKLIDILGNSYSNNGYAFLVDAEGEIINHPYGEYQMDVEHISKVSDLEYGKADLTNKKARFFTDYDGQRKLIIATKNEISGFTVYKVSSVWTIFSKVIIYGLLCLMIFILCIIIVYRLITNLITWQDKINRQLKETADIAIAAGDAKSKFLAQMSHEIRTPINAILVVLSQYSGHRKCDFYAAPSA